MKELLEQVVHALEKVRCYSLREILVDYRDGRISADEAKERLIEFNRDFEKIDVEKPFGEEGEEVPVRYTDFIKIGDTDLPIYVINRISKGKYYKFSSNKMVYTIIINESTNDLKAYNNTTISWDSQSERDRQYLLLKDILCVRTNIRFN